MKLAVIEANLTIRDIEPRIWRRLLLSADLNLAQLHEVLQASLGWTDSHLHQFVVGGLISGAPEFDDGFAGMGSLETFEATNVSLKDFSFYPNDPLQAHSALTHQWKCSPLDAAFEGGAHKKPEIGEAAMAFACRRTVSSAAAPFLREYPGWIREYERAHAMRAALLCPPWPEPL